MATKATTKKKKPVVSSKDGSASGVKQPLKKDKGRYWEATGRRKTAVARARITEGKKASFVVNNKAFEDYFQDTEYRIIAKEALERGAADKAFEVSVLVRGGGVKAQAEAMRHALARALVKWDETMREPMKTLKFLTRDPRMRERKKFGLKRARRARQWHKR